MNRSTGRQNLVEDAQMQIEASSLFSLPDGLEMTSMTVVGNVLTIHVTATAKSDLDPIYWFSAIFRAKHNHNWEAVYFFWLKWPICQTDCLWQHLVARKMTENH
jgi:hypothetical protein